MDKEQLYHKLPISLQHAACSIKGWRLQQQRFRGDFARLLAEAEARAFWSPDRIREYRDSRLQAFIRHATLTVPYYRRQFAECGIDPADIRTLGDLKHLPVLTKQEIQECYREMISAAVPHRQQMIEHTSGTTGGGLRFATTHLAIQEQWAVWWRYRRWHGIQLNTWHAYFGGRSVVPPSQQHPPYWRYNYPGKQILFSGYHMAPHTLDAYVRELRYRQPPWLNGYPSLLALLAAYLLDKGEDLGYPVRWVTIGAENLMPQQVELMERAFGVRPRQHYGTAEAVANISECELGNLHVDEDFSAVEFIPDTAGPGFRIVGTAFTNPAVAFLRYDVQDLASIGGSACACGRPGRVVEQLDGRYEDYIILRNGARLGRLDHIFKDLVNIREAQIVQREPGVVTFRIVRGQNYTEIDECFLRREAFKRLGTDTEIKIEYVNSLPRTRTGKLRFVVSEIAYGRLDSLLPLDDNSAYRSKVAAP